MNTILNLLTSDVHTAFVSLWVLLRDDIPFFHEAQRATLDDDDGHRQAKENIISRLMENSPLKIRNIPITFPLAILEAVDEYLYLYHGTKYNAPPPLLKVKDKTYIIHRQEKRGKKNIIHAQQTGHILTYLHYHWIIPQEIKGINVSVKKLPITGFDDSLFSGKKEIRIYIGSFSDGITPYRDEEHQPNFLAKGLTDPEIRWEGIEKCLNEASEAEADIVVFPELSICPKLREQISLWLDEHDHSFLFVLPGTFHQKFDGKYFNYTELFGPTGKPVLTHCKLTTAGIRNKYEKISTGRNIDLLDTMIGLIGIPICLDFCEEGFPFGNLWEQIGAHWFLVPAFGDQSNISAHLRRAQALHRAHGTVTALSNQTPSAVDSDHGFVCYSNTHEIISQKKRCISVDI